MEQNLFRQGMFMCNTRFITIIRRYRLKNWKKLKRCSCCTEMIKNIYNRDEKKLKVKKHTMNDKILLHLPKTIEPYPGSACNI